MVFALMFPGVMENPFLKRRIPRNSANRGRSMLQWLPLTAKARSPVLAVGFRWRASYLPTHWIGDDRTLMWNDFAKHVEKIRVFLSCSKKCFKLLKWYLLICSTKDPKPCRKTWCIFQHTVTTHCQSIRLNC